jgi:hypothetical protein
MTVSKKCKYPQLKEELKARQAESQAIRRQIHESSGMERWGFWQDKRRYGAETRDLLLAYAFLRGLPYRLCETKTKPNSGPYARDLQRCLIARGHEVAEDAIETWLKAEPSNAAVAA